MEECVEIMNTVPFIISNKVKKSVTLDLLRIVYLLLTIRPVHDVTGQPFYE